MIGDNTPIVIFGTGRSGTTLLSEILFQHQDLGFPLNYNNKFPTLPWVSFVGKLFSSRLFFGKNQIDNKGDLLQRFVAYPSEAWKLWDHITGLGTSFSRGFLLDTKPDEYIINYVEKYLTILLKSQHKNSFVCKFTGPSRLGYLSCLLNNPNFIWVKRSIIPTIYSFLQSKFWKNQGINSLWWNGAYNDSELEMVNLNMNDPLWMTTFQLKKVLDIYTYESKITKSRIFHLQYEDMIKNPHLRIGELFEEYKITMTLICKNYITRSVKPKLVQPDTFYFSSKQLDKIYDILNYRLD